MFTQRPVSEPTHQEWRGDEIVSCKRRSLFQVLIDVNQLLRKLLHGQGLRIGKMSRYLCIFETNWWERASHAMYWKCG
jgi:hypothetical protein